MQVRDGMSPTVLTVGPGHTLRAVARLMSERRVGAAVVIDPDGHGPGIITERDVLHSLGARAGPRQRARRRASDPRRRVRRARLVPGGGGGRDGARRLSPPDRARAGRDRGHPVRPRRRALLDRRWGDLPGAGQRGGGVRGPPRREGAEGSRAVGATCATPLRSVERELVDFATRVFDPADRRSRSSAGRR